MGEVNHGPDDSLPEEKRAGGQDVVGVDGADEDVPAEFEFTLPDDSWQAKDLLLWAGVIALFALVVYGPALRGAFLWDDDQHVSASPVLHSSDGLLQMWFHLRKAGEFGPIPQYYPLTHTTYWLEYQAWGLETIGYHVVNVLLHAAGAIGLWFVLRRLRVPGAWVAAAAFALHPLEVESVAWISERKNVLSGAFFFASIWAYLAAAGIGREKNELDSGGQDLRGEAPNAGLNWSLYALSFALFVCALLSKTVVCGLPVVILLVLWWRRRLRKIDVLSMVPFLVVGAALAALTAHMESAVVIGADKSDWQLTLAQRIAVAGKAFWFYPMKLVWPAAQSFNYSRWDVTQGGIELYGPALAAVALIVVLAALVKVIGRAPLVAVLAYFVLIFPALGFADVYPMRYSFVADHFQYLAGVPLIVLAVGIVGKWLARPAVATLEGAEVSRPIPLVASFLAVVLLVALGATTMMRARVFAGPETLWRDTLAKNPHSWLAMNNLGNEIVDDAVKERDEFNSLRPNMTEEEVASNRADIVGQFRQADDLLKEAIAENPQNDRAYTGYGRYLLVTGRAKEAIPYFKKALEISQRFDSYANMGMAYERLGQFDDAKQAYLAAIDTKPPQPLGYLIYARFLRDRKQVPAAMDEYREALKLDPNYFDANLELGSLLFSGRQDDEALERLQVAARLKPDSFDAHRLLGYLWGFKGQMRPAMNEFRTALQLKPDSVEARNGLIKAMEAMHLITVTTQPTTTQAATSEPAAAPATMQ